MVSITFPQFEGQTPQSADPWSAFPDGPPQAVQGAQAAQSGDPFAAFPDQPPKESSQNNISLRGSPVSAPVAALKGAEEGASFGLAPAISGVHAAGMSTLPPEVQDAIDKNGHAPVLGALLAGLGKLGYENIIAPALGIGQSEKTGTEAYNKAREQELSEESNAQAQHPVAYLGGQLSGAFAGPAFGAAKGATTLSKLGSSTLAGTIGGGLYGGGSAISQNESPSDILKSVGGGAATGAIFGAGGSAAVSGVGAAGSKLASVIRGHGDTDAEASRRIVAALSSDFNKNGPSLDHSEISAANQAGLPRAIVDAGGERTRALARSAANTSPEARQALTEMTGSRFEQQAPRISSFVRALTGGGHAADDIDTLQTAARAANKPLYQRAYSAGDRSIISPEIEQLIGTPAVESAIKGAVERGKNRAVLEGFGAFRSGVTVTPNGSIKFNAGPRGVPTYPNLQFWDYVQRELRDMASAADRAGRKEEAGALKGLHKKLLSALDNEVPQFAAARKTASSFFGAQDALEAGRDFVMSNASLPEARRALAKMSTAERELFARGFASELADKIAKTGDNRNVLNSIFLNNGPARQKVVIALGAQRASQLEALLRAESIVDEARKALGNSTTARQLAEMGLAGGAVATFEGLKEHSFNPAHVIAAALTFGAVRHGAKIIDEKVARRVGELLASDNPALLRKGMQIVVSRPVLLDALRRASGAGAKVAAHDIGLRKALAGAGALLQRAIAGPGNEFQAGNDLADQFTQ